MRTQRDCIREQAEVSGRRSSARRRQWVWLFVVPTVVAVVALLFAHAAGAAWPTATGAALSTCAIIGAAIAAALRRRDRR